MSMKKIQIGVDDVRYLRSQALAAAHRHTDSKVGGDSYVLNRQVKLLVTEFVDELFEGARKSMVIAEDTKQQTRSLADLMSESNEKIEPIDFALEGKMRELYQEVEDQTIKVTGYRRNIPVQLQQLAREQLLKVQEQQRQIEQEIAAQTQTQEEETVVPDMPELERKFEESLAELEKLKRDAPDVESHIAKLEKMVEVLNSR